MSHDTWIHRMARVAVRPLGATRVTPNQITTLRLATGLAAAAALAHGDETWRSWGAGLFLFSMFLDRADGELARLSGKSSDWGHRYDFVSDALCAALAFAGLGLGLRDGVLGDLAPLLGLLAGIGIGTIYGLIMAREKRGGQVPGRFVLVSGVDQDDFLVILPLMIWFGLSEWLIVAACIGAPVYAFVLARGIRGGPGKP